MTGSVRPGLTPAQRRALLESDKATGRLAAREQTCAALAAMGLAVRYGRVGDHYLTAAGRRLRAELSGVEPPQGTSPPGPPSPGPPAGFRADDGNLPRADPGPARAAQVTAAWSGLLEIRRLLGDGDVSRPAPWERERFVHAVSLALEAAGRPPSAVGADGRHAAPGYSVTAAVQPGLAEVSWHGDSPPEGLASCQDALERYGWQCTRHTDRAGRWFLLVSPRRA